MNDFDVDLKLKTQEIKNSATCNVDLVIWNMIRPVGVSFSPPRIKNV